MMMQNDGMRWGRSPAEGDGTLFRQLLIDASLRECDGHDIIESDDHAIR